MSILKDNLIRYYDQEVTSWEIGVEIASKPLIENGYVSEDYVAEVISITNKLGPYYVLAPQIALLHIPPNNEMKENAISFTYFKKPIIFKDEDKYHVNYCLALVAKDSDSHMNILQAVANLFTNQVFLDELVNVNSQEDILKIVKKFDL